MDITVLRSLTTVVSFITFVGIVVWAYKRSNQSSFDDAARLPFLDEELEHGVGSRTGSQS